MVWLSSFLDHRYTRDAFLSCVNLPGSAYHLLTVALKLHQTYSTRALTDKPDGCIINDWAVYDKRWDRSKLLLCRGVHVCVSGREGGRLQWLSIERCPLGITAPSAFQETTYNSWNIQWQYIQCFSHINTSHNGLLFNILSSDIWIPRAESCYYSGEWGEHNN